MKTIITSITCVILFILGSLNAQDVTTVTVKSSDISDNLDLEAVASLFGESENLEDFEKKLNDPELQISNLDLNKDGNRNFIRLNTSGYNSSSYRARSISGCSNY